MLNQSQLITLFDQDQRKDVEHINMRREVTPTVVRHIDISNIGEGVITYSQLNEANAEEVIHEQVTYFQSLEQDFEWKVYDYDRPSDLLERLETHGFQVEETEAVMVLDLDDAPDSLWQPIHHNVQQILVPEKLSDVLIVEQRVWDEDCSWLSHYLGEALLNYPEQMSVYVAYVDKQPASAAWIYFPAHSQFASLWGGATISSFRKQGLYTALLSVRTQEAKERQVKYLCVDANATIRPIFEKYGFEKIAYSYPCYWKHTSQALVCQNDL